MLISWILRKENLSVQHIIIVNMFRIWFNPYYSKESPFVVTRKTILWAMGPMGRLMGCLMRDVWTFTCSTKSGFEWRISYVVRVKRRSKVQNKIDEVKTPHGLTMGNSTPSDKAWGKLFPRKYIAIWEIFPWRISLSHSFLWFTRELLVVWGMEGSTGDYGNNFFECTENLLLLRVRISGSTKLVSRICGATCLNF